MRQATRTVREFTPEERQHCEQARAQAEAEKPEMIKRYRLSQVAAAEATLSGQLRRAVNASKLEYGPLADRCGISADALDDFMCGLAPLGDDAFDRLAAALHLQLAQIP